MRYPARVAIIDDELSIRRALLRLLRVSGFDAKAYGSVTAFLDDFAARRPDCILLDLKMPETTGLDLLRRFADYDDPPPVIVVTANDDALVRGFCERLGSRAWLQKPVDSATLLDCLRETLAAA